MPILGRTKLVVYSSLVLLNRIETLFSEGKEMLRMYLIETLWKLQKNSLGTIVTITIQTKNHVMYKRQLYFTLIIMYFFLWCPKCLAFANLEIMWTIENYHKWWGRKPPIIQENPLILWFFMNILLNTSKGIAIKLCHKKKHIKGSILLNFMAQQFSFNMNNLCGFTIFIFF
jgi:hypothetical protein